MENNQEILEFCERIAYIEKEERICIDEMRKSKVFKFAYLLTRIEKELIHGDSTSRKRFVNWLLHRDHEKSVSDLHYVLRIDMASKQMWRKLQRKYPELQEVSKASMDELKVRIHQREIEKIQAMVNGFKGQKIIVFPDVVDWNIPLFQRPQQMAMAFAQEKVLCIYVTPNYRDDIIGLTKIQDCCYLITGEYMHAVLEIAKFHGKETILEVSSTDNLHSMEDVNAWRQHCSAVLYEYIDEISDEITGKVPKQTIERHKALLKDESVYVVATADKLYDEVVAMRGSNVRCLNSGNGVDCGHFTVEKDISRIPETIRPIIEKNKPIIGYFGAIANWFDFELIAYAAKKRPEYEFLMIGPKYGSHDMSVLKQMEAIENLHFVGAVEYKTLPYVASHFTVATIPFKINEITESTSPIKLFEYMAMGKPCVTTAMRECFKYPVVRVSKNADEYVDCLDEAVSEAKNPCCEARMKAVAAQNSWLNKAKEIIELLES